jgi:perosamine synthetase
MENARLDVASRLPWAVFPRKRLDASFVDFYGAAFHCLEAAPDEARYSALTESLEQAFHPLAPAQGLVTLSVRTTWDLFLGELDLPPGSEVIMSGITIKDMVSIVITHGFVPIAVDIDPATLEMDPAKLEQAITPRTRVIIVSHIFGAIGDASMRRVTEIARERGGIAVFEDCAEAYVGPDYRGHPDSTLSAFSFGTIKTDTALGGCLSVVTDPVLLDRLRTVRERKDTRDTVHARLFL